ncbi:MAG: hypothetical protein ACM3U1_03225 [Chloroflexota bacterium]
MKRFLIALVMAMSCLTSALSAQVGTGGDTVWTRAIGAVEQVRFSPDGTTIYASRHLYENSEPTVALDAANGEIIRQFPGINAYRIDLSADGMFLAGCNEKDTVYEWNALTGELLGKYTSETTDKKFYGVLDVAYSADGKYLIGRTMRSTSTLTKTSGFVVWERATKKISAQVDVTDALEIVCSPNRDILAVNCIRTNDHPATVELYSTNDWQFKGSLKGHTDVIEDMSFSPDGKYLATGGGDGVLKIWDVEKKQIYWEVSKAHIVPEVEPMDPGAVHSLAFINNEYIISGGSGAFISPSTVKLRHIPTKQLITTIFCSAFHDIATTAPALGIMGGSKALTLIDFSKYLGAKEKKISKETKIRPNPVKEQASLEFTPEQSGFYTIKLYDGAFKEISTISEEFLDNKPQRIPIQTEKLLNGVYYIQISTATTTQTISFIVEK